MYKYSLDKSSKKYICPNCKKKRFVRFINIETNEYLDENYGRCDRETSCGYSKKPENDFAKHTINVFSNENNFNNTHIIQDINPTYHTTQQLQKSLRQYCNNNFYIFLTSLFSIEKVQEVFEQYKIGTSKTWEGATVFWQIDNDKNIRAGKIILLNKTTCKRVKEPYPHITWVHTKLKLESFKLNQCLFGLHLANNSNKIAITESEKTAIIMSLFIPEYTWLATGGKGNFNEKLLEPIKNYKILVFPDKSEFEDWNNRTNELNRLGYKIICSQLIENKDVEKGYDLADYYIENRRNTKSDEIKYTKAEILVNQLTKVNPEIITLIRTFDLVDNYFNDIINID